MNREELSAYVCSKISQSNKPQNIALMAGTGVGKSKLSLDIIRKVDFKDSKTLILIAERAHKKNWEEEIEKWYPEHIGSIEFFCYASMHKLKNEYDFIIFDEAHHLNTSIRIGYFGTLVPKLRIFLSATLSYNFLNKLEYCMKDTITKINYSLQDAIDSGIIQKPEIRLIPLELDNKVANEEIVETWGKNKLRKRIDCDYNQVFRFTSKLFKKANPNAEVHIRCTQLQHYEYLTKKMDYYKRVFEMYRSEIMKNQWLQYGSRRKRFLGELKTKEAEKLIKYVEDKRFICFCTSIEQANELGGNYAIHSKSDSKALEDFNSFKSNKLFAVNMLQEGMNLKGIEVGIIVQLDGQKLRFIQRTGRVLRSDFPVQYILYFKNTRDEEYLVNALEGINEEYVKEFKYEDNN